MKELDLNENRTHYLPNNIKELLLKYLIKGGLNKRDELYKTFYQDSTLNLPFNIFIGHMIDFIKKSKKDTIYVYFVEGKSVSWNTAKRKDGSVKHPVITKNL